MAISSAGYNAKESTLQSSCFSVFKLCSCWETRRLQDILGSPFHLFGISIIAKVCLFLGQRLTHFCRKHSAVTRYYVSWWTLGKWPKILNYISKYNFKKTNILLAFAGLNLWPFSRLQEFSVQPQGVSSHSMFSQAIRENCSCINTNGPLAMESTAQNLLPLLVHHLSNTAETLRDFV